MALLDDALAACGGLDRWRRLKRFTVHISLDGAFFARTGRAGLFKDMVAEGSTQTQSLQLTGFTGPDKCALYQPDLVAIQDLSGEVLGSCSNPGKAFPASEDEAWDDLQLAYFCGFSIWNYLAIPFLLAHPDIEIEELAPWSTNNQVWRRLRAMFPPTIVTHSREQIFYFDASGLQRRADHKVIGTPIAQLCWAHQQFCDVVIPTLRRSLTLQPDGSMVARPAFMDIEIFDAAFE